MKFTPFWLLLLSTLLFSKGTITHIAQLAIKQQEHQSICLLLSSDHEKVITKTKKGIDIWNSHDLKHLGGIKNVPHGWSCKLHDNNRYLLVQDMKKVYLYDLKEKKQIKEFSIPDKKHNDSIMSASFSKDGKHINVFQYAQTKPGYSQPALFRYNIQSGERKKVKTFITRMASNELKGDTLYTLDNIQKKIFVYDIKKDKTVEGTQKAREIFKGLYSWGDCHKQSPRSKICTMADNIKYSLANGSLTRTDIENNSSTTPKITYIHKRPLRKSYFYELGFQMPYAVTKRTQQYQAWDLSKGKQIWNLQQKTTISTEFDSVPTKGIFFIPEQKRVLVIGGFEDEVYNFDLETGLFSYLPKKEKMPVYNSFSLEEDHKIYSITHTFQKPPYPLKTLFFNLKTGEYLPNYDASHFHPDGSDNPTHSILWDDGSFDLYRSSDKKLLAVFSLFENDEWLVMTPEGYFNASSSKVAVNILKKQHKKVTIDAINQLIAKWHRPDIVEALLTNKDTEKLKNRSVTFSLPQEKAKNDLFGKSILTQVPKNKRYELLRRLERNRQRSYLPLIYDGIKQAESKEAFKAYYTLLTRYPFKYNKSFIESRIPTLTQHSFEQLPLLKLLYSKKPRRDRKMKMNYIPMVIQKTKFTDDAQRFVVKKMKIKLFEQYESLLWDTGERLHYLPAKVLSFLEKKDLQRAQKMFKAYKVYQEKKVRNTIVNEYAKLLKTKKFTKERNKLDSEIYTAFTTINDMNLTSDLFKEKKIAAVRLDAYFHNTDLMPYTVDSYLHFLMKYSSQTGKQILHTKIEIYLLSFYKEKNKNSHGLFGFLKAYLTYEPEFVVNTLIDLAQNAPRNTKSSILYSMQNLKDPKFVPTLLSKLDFKDSMISNHALETLLRYDEKVINQTITELNKLDDCSKINYLDIKNSFIAKKISKKDFARYHCGMKTD